MLIIMSKLLYNHYYDHTAYHWGKVMPNIQRMINTLSMSISLILCFNFVISQKLIILIQYSLLMDVHVLPIVFGM